MQPSPNQFQPPAAEHRHVGQPPDLVQLPGGAVARFSPEYGTIPAVWVPGGEGPGHGFWAFDLDFRPPSPPGAVAGNPARQEYCAFCHAPRYYYQDRPSVCAGCGRDFVFSAREQKHWYEALKLHVDSKAVRCPACRREARYERGAMLRLDEARQALRLRPDDPESHLETARAIASLRAKHGRGPLDQAILACRTARRLGPQDPEPDYWEGVCQALANRSRRAQACLEEFVSRAATRPELAHLVADARLRMDAGRMNAGR